MLTLTIKPSRVDNYILPELAATTLHLVITKPRTSTQNIYSYVAPIYSNIMKKSNNTQQQTLHELPIALVKGSSYARSLRLSDKFIGLNPINIKTDQKFCARFINYDGIKKNGFKLLTNEQLKDMTYLRNNANRANYSIIYVLKAKDVLTYEIMKKLETNQHLLPPITDIYRIAQFIKILINQNTPDLYIEPSVIQNI